MANIRDTIRGNDVANINRHTDANAIPQPKTRDVRPPKANEVPNVPANEVVPVDTEHVTPAPPQPAPRQDTQTQGQTQDQGQGQTQGQGLVSVRYGGERFTGDGSEGERTDISNLLPHTTPDGVPDGPSASDLLASAETTMSAYNRPYSDAQIEGAERYRENNTHMNELEPFEMPPTLGVQRFMPVPDTVDEDSELLDTPNSVFKSARELGDKVIEEAQKTYDDMSVQSEATHGMAKPTVEKPQPPAGDDGNDYQYPSMHQQSDVAKKNANSQVQSIKEETDGGRLWAKLIPMSSLGLREVMVGINDIMEAIKVDPTPLNSLVSSYVGEEVDLSTMEAKDVADLINSLDIYVAMAKPPHNVSADYQRRLLRIGTGPVQRGIYLNPCIASVYNADYDGDDANVSFVPSAWRNLYDPMELLLDYDGNIRMDLDYLPMFTEMTPPSGVTIEDYVSGVILAQYGVNTKEIADAIIKLSEAATNPKARDSAWVGLIRAISKACNDKYYRTTANMMTDKILSDLINVYQENGNQILNRIADESSRIAPEFARYTRDDQNIVLMLESWVFGSLPNNFQEFRVSMHTFFGDVEGKNAPFRFTADIANAVKMHPDLRLGDGTFQVDPNNEVQLKMFWDCLMSTAQSQKMTKEVFRTAHNMTTMSDVRKRVIEEVGFPDSKLKDGSPRYANFVEFLDAFGNSYAKWTSLINSANVKFNQRYGIADNSWVVREISKTTREDADGSKREWWSAIDLATPFIETYGSFLNERMFPHLFSGKSVSLIEADPYYYRTNPNDRRTKKPNPYQTDVRLTRSGLYILKKYAKKSILSTKSDNNVMTDGLRLLLADDNNVKTLIRDEDIRLLAERMPKGSGMDEAAEFLMFLAISDKRRSTASSFNTKTYGNIRRPPKQSKDEGALPRAQGRNRLFHWPLVIEDREKYGKRRPYIKQDTVIGKVAHLVSELSTLNRQGSVITSARYACVGWNDLGKTGGKILEKVRGALSDQSMVGMLDQLHLSSIGTGTQNETSIADILYNKSSSKTKYSPFGSDDDKNVIGTFDLAQNQRDMARRMVERYLPNGTELSEKYGDKKYDKNSDDKDEHREYLKYLSTARCICGDGGMHDMAQFLICYSGGNDKQTKFAISLARHEGIPVFDLAEYGLTDEGISDWADDIKAAADNAYNNRLTTMSTDDRMLFANDVVEALVSMGIDLFHHFNIASPLNFLQTRYAQKMVENKDDLEVIGGIRLSMVFQMAMDEVDATTNLVKSIDKNAFPDVWARAQNMRSAAMMELCDRSQAWEGIVRELENSTRPGSRGSLFTHMKEKNGSIPRVMPAGGKTMEDSILWAKMYDAVDFWTNNENSQWKLRDYDSLRDVMDDLDMPIYMKCWIIADVVKWHTNDTKFSYFEVPYQLELSRSELFSPDGSNMRAANKTYDDMSEAYNRWSKRSADGLRKNINDAARSYENVPDALTNTLRFLRDNPQLLVEYSDADYADAILAVKDKVSDQMRKATSHNAVNHLYTGLTFQNNGRFINEFEQTDDRCMGILRASKVDIMDVIKVLCDPEEVIDLYFDDGTIGELSYDSLIGGPYSEKSIWQFLKDNPRIASCVKFHSVGGIADSKGTAYVGSNATTKQTITLALRRRLSPETTVRGKIKYLFRDFPEFAGIISLLSPGRVTDDGKYVGSVSRTENLRIREIEDHVISVFYDQMSATPDDRPAVIQGTLDALGINEDVLYDNYINDWHRKMGSMKRLKKSDRKVYEAAEAEALTEVGKIMARIEETLGLMYDRMKSNDVDLGLDISVKYSMSVPTIVSFKGEHDFLENDYEHPFTYKGIQYKCAEAAFLAQMSDNPEVWKAFGNLSAEEAREASKKIKSRNKNFTRDREAIMEEVLLAKFGNEDLKRRLADTGLARIVATDNGTFWGVSSSNYGSNVLGDILMRIRGNAASPSRIGIDKVSVASFFDVIQDLTAAKTQISTGVEGNQTYENSAWIATFDRKDRFGEFSALRESITLEWDGLLTTARNDDGTYIRLEFDSEGNLANEWLIDQRDSESNPVIVMVPDDFIVPDMSTNVRGKQISSLAANSMAKRGESAETHNLKAAKSGNDKLHSIIKIIGKYRYDNKKKKRVRYRDVLDDYRNMYTSALRRLCPDGVITDEARQSALLEVKMDLANTLKEENDRLGYEFSLCHCLCVADVMVILGDDKNVHLRTLGMIVSALRGRYGHIFPGLTENEVLALAKAAVDDTSETGIGIARTSRRSATSILSDFTPKGKVSSMSSLKSVSSYAPRNFSVIENIYDNVGDIHSQREIDEADEFFRGIDSVSSVLSRCSLARDYKVTSAYCMGLGDGEVDAMARGLNAIGPVNMLVIGDADADGVDIKAVLDDAERYGMSALVSASRVSEVPDEYMADAVLASDYGDILIPFFDIQLNGTESQAYTGKRVSVFQSPHSSMQGFLEDPINSLGMADAEVRASQHAVDNIGHVQRDQVEVDLESLFPNVRRQWDTNDGSNKLVYSVAGLDEVYRAVNGGQMAIDYTVPEVLEGKFEKAKQRVMRAFDTFVNNYSNINEDGVMAKGLTRGDIVAWAKCDIYPSSGGHYVAFAPIIPFPMDGSTVDVPNEFAVIDAVQTPGSNTCVVDWVNTSDITNGHYKVFISLGFASKGMMSTNEDMVIDADTATLENGFPVSLYGAESVTMNRAIGTEKRMKTMNSLMEVSRQVGYNFARVEGSFPNDPDTKAKLLAGAMTIDDWNDLLSGKSNYRFISGDASLNAWINNECRKFLFDGVNPTLFLASKYYDEAGNVVEDPHFKWEYNMMFEPELSYEDFLLRFINTMDETLCPSGVFDDSLDHLFVLKREMPFPWSDHDKMPLATGFDQGVLQVYGKYPTKHGVVRQYANFYVGPTLLGKEWSGLTYSNVSGSTDFADALSNAKVWAGKVGSWKRRKQLLWAAQDNATPLFMNAVWGSRRSSYYDDEMTDSDDDWESTDSIPEDLAMMFLTRVHKGMTPKQLVDEVFRFASYETDANMFDVAITYSEYAVNEIIGRDNIDYGAVYRGIQDMVKLLKG